MTPKFSKIIAAGTGGSHTFTGNVSLYGLTENGEVYEWSGHSRGWVKLENPENESSIPRSK